LAKRLAEALLSAIPEVVEAQCLVVSRIAAPISMPALVHVKLGTRDDMPIDH
jgi:S-adenosylmethionine synthetase